MRRPWSSTLQLSIKIKKYCAIVMARYTKIVMYTVRSVHNLISVYLHIYYTNCNVSYVIDVCMLFLCDIPSGV